MILTRIAIALMLSILAAFAGSLAFADVGASGVANDGASHAQNEQLSVQVKSVVELDGNRSEILLSDLIVAHGADQATIKKLSQVRLADMPNAGESRTFTSAALEQIFHPLVRDIEETNGKKISLRIPARVIVTRKSLRLNAPEIEAEITRQLKLLCGDCVFEFSSLSLPALPTSIPFGSTWSLQLHHEIPRGSFSFPLEVVAEDGGKRSYWLSGVLSVSRKVPVASRQISAGEHLQPEDFALQLKDVTFSNDIPASEGDMQTSVAAREIAAGQILWRSSLRRELAVKNGEAVKVIAGSGDWQVSIDGIAQTQAYIGDTVSVKIPRTSKLISGLLKEKGIVEVRE